MEKKGILLIALLAVVLAGLIASGYSVFYYMHKCDAKECFDSALAKCGRASFTNENPDTIIAYRILGKSSDKCKVNVEIIQVKRGSAELASLEGKNMDCFLTLGVVTEPEENLKDCHGLLKEEIQDMIIKRMHSQIIENLGKISEETTKIL